MSRILVPNPNNVNYVRWSWLSPLGDVGQMRSKPYTGNQPERYVQRNNFIVVSEITEEHYRTQLHVNMHEQHNVMPTLFTKNLANPLGQPTLITIISPIVELAVLTCLTHSWCPNKLRNWEYGAKPDKLSSVLTRPLWQGAAPCLAQTFSRLALPFLAWLPTRLITRTLPVVGAPGCLIVCCYWLLSFSVSFDCFTSIFTLISNQLRWLCSRITGPSWPGIESWLTHSDTGTANWLFIPFVL